MSSHTVLLQHIRTDFTQFLSGFEQDCHNLEKQFVFHHLQDVRHKAGRKHRGIHSSICLLFTLPLGGDKKTSHHWLTSTTLCGVSTKTPDSRRLIIFIYVYVYCTAPATVGENTNIRKNWIVWSDMKNSNKILSHVFAIWTQKKME